MSAGAFRPIYYLGCKAAFAPVIRAAIDQVDPSGGRVIDLFSGTGSVGAALGSTREVTTVDVQEYSRVICSAVLRAHALSPHEISKLVARVASSDVVKRVSWCLEPLIAHERMSIRAAVSGNMGDVVELIESSPIVVRENNVVNFSNSCLEEAYNQSISRLNGEGMLQSPDTTMCRYFGGLYFSFYQSVALDGILSVANSFDTEIKDTLTAAALSTASILVNTVGKQFAQPIQPRNKSGSVKPDLLKVVRRDREMNALELYQEWLGKYAVLPQAIGEPKFVRQDFREAIASNSLQASVIYADPPYTRDHYSRFYHVLETMCLRDNPMISTVMKNGSLMPSRGSYREGRCQSEFCIRSIAPTAFDDLFRLCREQGLPIILSYSPHETGDGTHPRVVALQQILDIARDHYSNVEVCNIEGITHNQLNRTGLKLKSREHAEVLIKCFCR